MMEHCFLCSDDSVEIETISECGHNVCHRCLCKSLKNLTSIISCPVENCNKFIEEELVKKCLSNQQLAHFNILCLSNNAVKCLVKECNYFTTFIENKEHFICPMCEQYNCLRCNRLHILKDCSSIVQYDPTEIETRACDILKMKRRSELLSLYQENYLIPNPEECECSICDKFNLPRVGVILRGCLHSFCKDCLKMSFMNIIYICQLTCPKCRRFLDCSEILAVINEDKFTKMMIEESSAQFFQCKNGDCYGISDMKSDVLFFECLFCAKMNCLQCLDIHEGKTCEEFKKTKRYISHEDQLSAINENPNITCRVCSHTLIRSGGCSSMSCIKCGNSTCLYTGKVAGKHDIKVKYSNES